jgi:hypothetical protein
MAEMKLIERAIPLPVGSYINPNAERFVKDLFKSSAAEIDQAQCSIVLVVDGLEVLWQWRESLTRTHLEEECLGKVGFFTFELGMLLTKAYDVEAVDSVAVCHCAMCEFRRGM